MTENKPTLRSIRQFCTENPAFTEQAIRYRIFHEETNGFAGAFPRVGRRRYVWVEKFFDCVMQQNAA